jgi:hypothetical protein
MQRVVSVCDAKCLMWLCSATNTPGQSLSGNMAISQIISSSAYDQNRFRAGCMGQACNLFQQDLEQDSVMFWEPVLGCALISCDIYKVLATAAALPHSAFGLSNTFAVTRPQLHRLPVHSTPCTLLAAVCKVWDAAGVSVYADVMSGSAGGLPCFDSQPCMQLQSQGCSCSGDILKVHACHSRLKLST